MAEFGLNWPEIAGVVLLGAVFFTFILAAGFVAATLKGRSILAWGMIAAGAQIVAILLPITIIALTGLADPRDFLTTDGRPDFSTFRLFAEMSVVAGFTTLAVLSFVSQTKWKICQACEAHIPWRDETCPRCASSQTLVPSQNAKMEPGAYPRLTARTIHLPVELDEHLKQSAMPLKKRGRMTEEAAVSQYIRHLLEELDAQTEAPADGSASAD